MPPRATAVTLSWVCLAVIACGSQEPASPLIADLPAGRNVVLVTIDTLRADHLGVYGYDVSTSPHIDALASEALLFEDAKATCAATAPATASILTGHHRATHGVARNGSIMPESVETIGEILSAAGFRTAGFIANPTLDAQLGFGQGFEIFGMPESLDTAGPGRFGGPPLVTEAERVLAEWAQERGPFFLWIHFMDPHGAYFPPREYREAFPPDRYEDGQTPPLVLSEKNHGLDLLPRYQRLKGQKPGSTVRAAELRARYDAEIRYVDDRVGDLISVLHRLDLWDETVLVLTADHGESLGEHSYYFQHGWYLYDGSIRVPLLLRLPGLGQPKRIARTISMIDVAPTILDLVGLRPPESMEGRSLLAVATGGEGSPVFSQTYYGNRLTSLSVGNYKYIFTPPPPAAANDDRKPDGWLEDWPVEAAEELYNLADDPGETRNIFHEERRLGLRLRAQMRGWLEDQSRRQAATIERLEQDEGHAKQLRKLQRDLRLEEQLKSLGYL